MLFFQNYVSKSKRKAKKRQCKKLQFDKTLPPYEVLENTYVATSVPNSKHAKNQENNKPGQPDLGLHQRSFSHGAVSGKKAFPQISQIHPSTVLLPKKVNVTKQMRFAQHCVAAASQMLTPQQTGALKKRWNAKYLCGLTCPSARELSVQGLHSQVDWG